MSIEGQGHFFTIYFPGFVCFVIYLAKISGERLQDHWSSGFFYPRPYEPRCEKTCLRRFQLGLTQTGLDGQRLEISDLRSRGNVSINIAKLKALISCVETALLIYVFVFAYAKGRFSHDAVHIKMSKRLVFHTCFFINIYSSFFYPRQ